VIWVKIVSESNNTNCSMKTKNIIEQKALESLVGSTVEDSFMDIDNVLYILIKVNKSKKIEKHLKILNKKNSS